MRSGEISPRLCLCAGAHTFGDHSGQNLRQLEGRRDSGLSEEDGQADTTAGFPF